MKREHGIIQNALLWLESLGRLSEVTDIIPGVIDVSHSSERGIVYKYETQTGCKLLLKSNGSIQEVFVVTKNPVCVQEWVKKEFPSDSPQPVTRILSESNLQSTSGKKLPNTPQKPKPRQEKKTSTRSLARSKKRSYKNANIPNYGDQDSPNLADCLDLATLKALRHLKKSLENAKIQDAKAKFKNPWQK
ncbi:MAG: DUF2103 domain-containing protein [Desulfosporosinus sp.]|nr:DUF2103 domain-containing protein [Desulfosporosinus sp.]